jgi:hypothetical protein
MSAVSFVHFVRSDIILLASGPSVRGYCLRDIERRGTLIALNGAALFTKPDIAFTMDRLIAEYCHPMWYVQGVPSIWVRECTMKNFKPGPRTQAFQHDGPDTVMTDTSNKLNGSNSGTCALNLAYQLKPKQIFLFGYDMMRDPNTAQPYWHPPYPWAPQGATKDNKLKNWSPEFEAIAPQFHERGINVYVVNDWGTTRITAFPRISYKHFEEMTDAQ